MVILGGRLILFFNLYLNEEREVAGLIVSSSSFHVLIVAGKKEL